MSGTVTPLSDGGQLESWTDGGVHFQKYSSAGEKVGPESVVSNENVGPEIVPLANGGWVMVGGFAFRGYDYRANVFDGGGQKVATFNLPGEGSGYDIAASHDGGFLIVTMERNPGTPPGAPITDYTFQPYITLYDNSGAVVRGPVAISGDLPTVSVQADGDYLVQWNDGGIARSLEIDPQNPPALAKPPAPTLTILDDQGPNTGPVGDYTSDATPVARVTVTEVGTVLVSRVDGGGGYEPAPDGGIPVTVEDVARGYIDVPVPHIAADTMSTTWYARFKTADGLVSDRTSDSFTFILRPEIWSVTDDAGAQTGALANGATTDDDTPTVRIGLESSGLRAGETLYVKDGSTVVGQTVLTTLDVSRGFADITTSVLTNGAHSLSAQSGGPLPTFNLNVAASSASGGDSSEGQVLTSDQYADTLQGGAGSDTLHAGRGPDLLTGGGGADAFAFGELPWNAGHVTDFTVGTDRLDLSALFQASGYAGADPVADGWVRFDPDGAGGTKVYLDTNGPAAGGDWPWLITTLDGVPVTTWAQVADGAAPSSPPPPPSGAEQGQVLTSDQYADSLQGGAGDDTFHAGQGPDMLTGAAGADRFVWGDFPWNAGHVTDFTPGVDKLDLSALFAASTYTGSDPVGDGRLEFRPDGQGNTQVYLDRDDLNGGDWPFLITTLDGVSPAQIGPGDWLA